MRFLLAPAGGVFLVCVTLLSGCSASFEPSPLSPAETAFGNISGFTYGGQQALVGAHIYAYAAGTTAYGSASTSLLTGVSALGYTTSKDGNGHFYVTTDANGGFKLAASTTCTSGTQVYLYSIGGTSSTAASNTAAGLLAVLGPCPADGLLEDTVGSNTRIVMNEVSTVAAAFATAGFSVDSTDIGAPSIGNTLAASGIANAFANAGQIYSLSYGSAGASATTPYGNGSIPQAEVNSIANSLAACINSSGPSSTACSTLLADATSDGTSTGTAATDTAVAAIYIAQNPSSNVNAIFKLSGSAPPFAPTLKTAPLGFTINISFTGGGIAQTTIQEPHNLAVDASGNVWTTNAAANNLSEFSPLGVPLSPAAGFMGNGLSGPVSVAIDNSGNVWVPNSTGNSLSEFTSSGNAATGSPFSTGLNLSGPNDVAIDASGNVWVPNLTSSYVTKVTSAGALAASLKPNAANNLSSPYSIAIEPKATGYVWVSNDNSSGYATELKPTDVYEDVFSGVANGIGTAVDANGTAWIAQLPTAASTPNATVSRITTTATSAATITFAPDTVNNPSLDSVAVDGSDQIWVTDSGKLTLYLLSDTGAKLIKGLHLEPIPSASPDAVAIDGSGDVWYTTLSDGTLREVLGIAVPVVTPIAYGVAHSKLGTEP